MATRFVVSAHSSSRVDCGVAIGIVGGCRVTITIACRRRDNPDTRQAIMLLLELEGFDVEERATAGSAPMRALLSGSASSCSANMPRMDGVTFAASSSQIRAARHSRRRAERPSRTSHARAAGELDVPKPIDPDRLVVLVEKYCAARDGSTAV
jgi:hypothetical protein